MIIILSREAGDAELTEIVSRLESKGYQAHVSQGVERTLVGAVGEFREEKSLLMQQFSSLPYVESVVPIVKPYKLVSKEVTTKSVIDVDGVPFGGPELRIVAGPCAVEAPEVILQIAGFLKSVGVRVLRAGAYKPRTSPYSFQGMGEDGLKILDQVRAEHGLRICTEVMDTRDVELVAGYSDILQLGTRNMQNFDLLKEVGGTDKPVLLKRGMAATIEEWLLAAEYIASRGNSRIILCERGIRTFETYTRNTFDINAVVAATQLSHLPVVADASHGTGRREMVIPVSLAAVAAGADGVMVEMHPEPAKAVSDAQQTLDFELFAELVEKLRKLAPAVDRAMPAPAD